MRRLGIDLFDVAAAVHARQVDGVDIPSRISTRQVAALKADMPFLRFFLHRHGLDCAHGKGAGRFFCPRCKAHGVAKTPSISVGFAKGTGERVRVGWHAPEVAGWVCWRCRAAGRQAGGTVYDLAAAVHGFGDGGITGYDFRRAAGIAHAAYKDFSAGGQRRWRPAVHRTEWLLGQARYGGAHNLSARAVFAFFYLAYPFGDSGQEFPLSAAALARAAQRVMRCGVGHFHIVYREALAFVSHGFAERARKRFGHAGAADRARGLLIDDWVATVSVGRHHARTRAVLQVYYASVRARLESVGELSAAARVCRQTMDSVIGVLSAAGFWGIGTGGQRRRWLLSMPISIVDNLRSSVAAAIAPTAALPRALSRLKRLSGIDQLSLFPAA